jgi:hypothetical protein
MNDYEKQRIDSLDLLNWAINWPGIDNFVLLTPIIPRLENAYPVVFEYRSFQTSNNMYKRADLKVISMINEFTRLLKQDSYQISPKVILEGFSAGGGFAQRFAILHPEIVQAIAVGGLGGVFTLPEEIYQNIPIDWPVGINDLKTISGIEFDRENYKKIKQYIFYGDQDTGKNHNTFIWPLSWGTSGFWKSLNQIKFIANKFGDEDFIRVQNQITYLNSIGYDNISFHLYSGIGHEVPDYVIGDFMEFFVREIFHTDLPKPTTAPTPTPLTPTPVPQYTIDGYFNDWEKFSPVITDSEGDSKAGKNTDLTNIYSFQDMNYFYLLINTASKPITTESEIDIWLDTAPGEECSPSEMGITLHPNNPKVFAWDFKNCHTGENGYESEGSQVAWKDAIEVMVPLKDLSNFSGIIKINDVSFNLPGNNGWYAADSYP